KYDVNAMVHNTGGGLTKCLRVGSRIHYIKDNLPEPDPIFAIIKRESNTYWEEMFTDFNMGVGYELIVKREVAEDIIGIAESFNLGACVIGRCERSRGPNKLTVRSKHGTFVYTRRSTRWRP
ncbi:MAG: AIR synthase-related protein, partial [Candidatus Bathyarchaeia archaeon]